MKKNLCLILQNTNGLPPQRASNTSVKLKPIYKITPPKYNTSEVDDAEYVIADLDEYIDLLHKAGAIGANWHLQIEVVINTE